MEAMIICTAIVFLVRGLNSMCVKLAQRGRVASFKQAFCFVTIFAFFQFVLYFAFPPYTFHSLSPRFFIFPSGFATFYILSYIFYMLALSKGANTLTGSIHQFGFIITIIVGFFIWGEPVGAFQIAGLALLVFSVFISNRSGYSEGGIQRKTGGQWLIFVSLATLFSGCSIIFSKQLALEFPDYGKEYLLVYTAIATAISVPIALVIARNEFMKLLRDWRLILYTLAAAVTINITNYIFMMFVGKMTAAAFLPLISVTSMLSTALYSRVLLKEKMSRRAIIAMLLCLAAVVLLNL